MLCFHQRWAGWVGGLNVRINSLSRLLLFNPSCTRHSSSWQITSSKLVHAKKVWIRDCLRILPFSGPRLRILLDSSIDVIPKEAKLHVLLNLGQRGWFHPDAIWRVQRTCLTPWGPSSEVWQKTLWGELTCPPQFLFCLCYTVFPLSLLFLFMKAHPSCLYMLMWWVAAKTAACSCTLLLLLLPVLYRLKGWGEVLPRALWERAQRSQPLTVRAWEGELLGSMPITWESERY